MKRRIWIAGISIAIFVGVYVGSFFMVLAGQRLAGVEFLVRNGLTYRLSSYTDKRGFYFDEDPWMKIYDPLFTHETIFRRSKDPHARVVLNSYGRFVFATYYWGRWPNADWEKRCLKLNHGRVILFQNVS